MQGQRFQSHFFEKESVRLTISGHVKPVRLEQELPTYDLFDAKNANQQKLEETR